MSTNYPTSLDSYSTKANNVDVIDASHVNDLQDAIEAIEAQLAVEGWSTFTPTVVQSGAVAVTVNLSRYKVVNKICHLEMHLSVTGSGTAGNTISIESIPSAAQPRNLALNAMNFGTCTVIDSGTAVYAGFVLPNGAASKFSMRESNTRGVIGVNPSFALASSDVIILNCTYEVN